jgi:predicted SnoaL-like aldol condensation-catalyzing enzyme
MTLSNKEKARLYYQAVSRYEVPAVTSLVHPDYVQHNPRVPTGRAAFLALLPKLEAHASRIENLHILQEGAFVAMHHLWHNAHAFGAPQMLAFHVIRFDDEGLIAEHWSVMMPTPPDARPSVPEELIYERQHKVLREGDLSLTISEGQHGGRASAIYDLRRGAEHWQIINEIPSGDVANQNTMFGFPDD